MKINKNFLTKYILYLMRWQASTLTLAPVIAWYKKSDSIFGTSSDWISAIIANFIGGLIFFWIDRIIFRPKINEPLWHMRENVCCSDCKTKGIGYRIIRAKNYDRVDDPNPEFRCYEHSIAKYQSMKDKIIN